VLFDELACISLKKRFLFLDEKGRELRNETAHPK
jgi:hypothetical protein